MDSTKRAVKYQCKESKLSILRFWIVIIIIDIFAFTFNRYTSLTMGVHIPGIGMIDSVSIMTMNFLPIIIYLITYNYEMYYKQFPLALRFSMTRKDFFKSMVLNNIGIGIVFAIIQAILMKIDPIIVEAAGLNPRYDLISLNGRMDSLIYIIISLFIGFVSFAAIWNLIAVLNYKIGYKLWIVLGGVALFGNPIISLIPIDPGNWLNLRMDLLQFTKLSIITMLIYIPIYFLTINLANNKT